MLGLMQSQPLLISSLIEFADRHHGDGEIVSRRVEGDIHRYTWRDVARRARQVARRAGRHEAAVLATASPRWPGTATATWSCTSACPAPAACCTPSTRACTPTRSPGSPTTPRTRCCASTLTFLPLVQAVHARCPTIRQYVMLCDAGKLPADTGIPEPGRLRGLDRRPADRLRTGRSSTRTPRPACATRAAPRATPRPRSTATARPSCTPTRRRCRT